MPRKTLAFALAAVCVWLTAPQALAHTDFEFSSPADGAVIDEPISVITIAFSGEAEPSGEGFVVLDPSNELRVPDRITSTDNLTWELHFDEPIAEGTAGVRWTVAAPDAHPIQGSFSFTVTDPGFAESSPSPDSQPEPTVEPLTSTSPEAPASGEASLSAGPVVQAESPPLDEFLEGGAAQAPFLGLFGAVARSVSLLGAMVAIGGIVFAAVVLRGSEADIRGVLFWIRRASVLLAVGAVGELIHQLAMVNGDWLTVWPVSSFPTVLASWHGLAIAARIAGGGLMGSAHLDVVNAGHAADPVLALQSAVPVGAGPPTSGMGTADTEAYVRPDDKAWRVDGDLGLVLAGVAITLAGFAFDGHTVTEGIRMMTSVVAMAHAGAGAVWAGGLLMLAFVVWRRHQRGADSRAAQLAVRFSVVAAIALVVAGGAGVLLAVTILDNPSDLWLTSWGRVLLAKIALVGVAAASGAYNHKVLIPRLVGPPEHGPSAEGEFRRTILVEGVAMGVVIVLTAILVAAAS